MDTTAPPADLAAPLALRPGLHVWSWTKAGPRNPRGGYPDPGALAAFAHGVGAVGVLVHGVGAAEVPAAVRYADRAGARQLAPFQLTIAVGSRGPTNWERHFARPCVLALRAGYHAMLDWEITWDQSNGIPSAIRCVQFILNAVPDAR